MNAPTSAAALAKPSFEMLAVSTLKPSSTHIQELRRARFDSKLIQELAESIKAAGVLQPILVRPLEKGHEIVAGERRWLAARRAGLTEIPAAIHILSNEQVLEVQLIENLQREGLHELEEAEGYEELMKLKKVDADAVADMVGRSKSYVYKRAKLLALCPEARQAFYGGALDASRALLIARIGHHDTQREALKAVTKGRYPNDGPMNFKDAQKFILETYMLRLKEAPFDLKDEQLVPKAGSCVKCPKRTGNQTDLFGDVKDADTCTDPKCYDDKRQAGMSVERTALEAKGKKVVHGAEAKKVFPDWNSPNKWASDRMVGGYQKLNDSTWVTGKQKKISEILGDDYEPILVQHPGTGQIVKLATQQAVSTAAAKLTRKSKKAGKSSKTVHAGMSEEQRKLEDAVQQETAKRVLALVKSKHDGKLGEEEILFLGECALQDLPDEADILWETFGLKSPGWQVEKALAKVSSKDLPKLIAAGLVAGNLFDNYGPADARGKAILKRMKIDEKSIEKDVRAELKKTAQEKSKTSPAAKAKKK